MAGTDDRRKPSGLAVSTAHGQAAGDYAVGQYVPGPNVTILGVLGRGGFSTVYLVKTQDELLAALKVIHPHLARRSAVANRMIEEAMTIRRIQHPNVVRFLDCGWTADDHFRVYILMERLEGASGRQILQEKGGMLIQHALDVGISLLSGLEAVHAIGIIHRDLKPDNVFVHVAPNGEPFAKLYDFGIQEKQHAGGAAGDDGRARIRTFEGTPAYAAPEQLVGERATVRTDIFAFGTLFFEWLTGEHPQEKALRKDEEGQRGDDLGASHLVHDILYQPAPKLSEYLLVPQRLENVVAKCLETRPDRRYPNVTELRRDLEGIKATLHPDFIKSKKTTQQYLIGAVQAVRQAQASPSATSNERPIAVGPAQSCAPGDSQAEQPRAGDSTVQQRTLPLETPSVAVPVWRTRPAAETPAGGATYPDHAATIVDPALPEVERRAPSRATVAAAVVALVAVLTGVGLGVYVKSRSAKASAMPAVRVSAASAMSAAPGAAALEAPGGVSPLPSQAAVSPPMAATSLAASTMQMISGDLGTSDRSKDKARAKRAPLASTRDPDRPARGTTTASSGDGDAKEPAADTVDRNVPATMTAASAEPAIRQPLEPKGENIDMELQIPAYAIPKAPSSPTPKSETTMPVGLSAADQARKIMLRDPDAARRILEPRVYGPRPVRAEVELLATICRDQKDQTCVTQCKSLLERLSASPSGTEPLR
ncbi:protein kinase domain-containing protein [Pendulispora albinea]|uniref:non-specific serine/threonine protein kinase n=1 Tax=Pendulispora albinea TaxID=2741071 RepID=A0ABZ2LMP9_9BACT